ncbi:MAG TPA: MEDS domain-containing protein [Candidatus Thermoplasmatota archaeon]|nr:MEDS domain-containing protein [Candidatus Thermoplasmatota archaeon]
MPDAREHVALDHVSPLSLKTRPREAPAEAPGCSCATALEHASLGGVRDVKGLHSHGRVTPLDNGSRLLETLEAVQPGDHLCLVYETQQEQFAAAIPFLRHGLERGEFCVYIADDNNAAAVLDGLRAGGVDVEGTVASGALSVVTKREAYLKDGFFDPDAMISFLAARTEAAVAAGFTGLRVTGEMTWALGPELGVDRLMEYEAKLNEFFVGSNASAICQYSATRFGPEVILEALHTHPLVIYGGLVCRNFYFVPPEEYLRPGQANRKVQRLLKNILAREESEREIRSLTDTLEARVDERTRELLSANRELESFAYTISHDLKAPLRGIQFYAQLLEEDHGTALDAEGQAYLSRLRSESERLTLLVNDILSLSKAMQEEVTREPVDLVPIARGILDELAAANPGRRVSVVLPAEAPVEADPRLMGVVLQNLLGNAWKFTSKRPDARIELGVLPPTAPGDGQGAFFVRDNGAGFDASRADRLFEAFQRFHGGAEFEGTGIGLATVKRILRRHGGDIRAESRVGEGATFFFTL